MFVSLIRPPRSGEPALELSTRMFHRDGRQSYIPEKGKGAYYENYVLVENKNVDGFSEKLMKAYVQGLFNILFV